MGGYLLEERSGLGKSRSLGEELRFAGLGW